ncbi:hypothetical protein St703_04310 [Sporolactobacillus terrae]|uniref:Uncharacterized protein n=2 Tax=Sporolactobacillus terrae TaxID=269673 RepID=A0A5K7X0Z3_9BACL|nr:hypothetical protein St703_04310 [Sporolactobacillus terrae]
MIFGPAKDSASNAQMLWRQREQRAKEDPADQLRVRGGFRNVRGRRAAGVSFVHKVMNKARMEGGSKDRAYFAWFFSSSKCISIVNTETLIHIFEKQ